MFSKECMEQDLNLMLRDSCSVVLVSMISTWDLILTPEDLLGCLEPQELSLIGKGQ